MDGRSRRILTEGAAQMGVALDDVAVGRFDVYLRLLQSWGRTMNLTARLETREIVVHHFLDSLAGARWIGGGEGRALLDLGSGAGLPGLPLKIALPGLEVMLLDAAQKRVAFCRQVIREAGLSGIAALWGRAEEIAADPAQSGRFQWVASRAVAASARLVALSLPFLAPSGSVLLYKGRPGKEELRDLESLCRREGLSSESHDVDVPGLDAARSIVLVTRHRG